MAQSGLLIPARRGAKLPLFREIMMDVGDEQSLEQSLSTFGGHIERLKAILRQADRHSLVLLDELGSGTDPDEGGAIGQAVLDALGRTGCLAMVSTHISILKAYAMNHERVDNGSVEFDTQTLSPTYHLRIGTPGESHAITVAEKLGLPGRITDDARKHLGQRGQQFRRAMRRTGKARQIAEEARANADAAKVHAETQAETYEDKLDDVRKLKDEFTTFLHHISALKPGDKIWVPAAKKHGHLARLELHKQVALVNIGSLQLEVPLADMMPDLGRHDVRHELNQLHTRAEEQANQAAGDRDKAARLLAEAKTLEQQKRQQARQFDMWLNAIARVKVGDLAPIARKPGRGKVVEVNFPALRATIELEGGKIIQLPLQDLHPQTGPFAPGGEGTKKNASRQGKGNKKAAVRHRDPKSKSAKKDRRALLDTSPGEKVFVVPFQTAATLVRIDEDKNKATVLRGAFEIQVALSDLEPVGYQKEKRTP
jgi:dsDNA-specific endonuclease/ATPase MutS2